MIIRMITNAKLEMMEIMTVMEYAGDKAEEEGKCGVSTFGFVVPCDNDSETKTAK